MGAIALEPTKIGAFGNFRCLLGRLDPPNLLPDTAGEMGRTASNSSPQPTGPVGGLKRCVPLEAEAPGEAIPRRLAVSLTAVHLCVLGEVASRPSLSVSSAEQGRVVEMPPFTESQWFGDMHSRRAGGPLITPTPHCLPTSSTSIPT